MKTNTNVVAILLGLLIGTLGCMVVAVFYPWIPIEMTMNSGGYTIEGCDNEPVWFQKGSVYDCNSFARKRYKQYIHELKGPPDHAPEADY